MTIEAVRSAHAPRVGLFGIGLEMYWRQFAGLKERFRGYLGQVERKLRSCGVHVVNLGLIDTPEKALRRKIMRAGTRVAKEP